MADYNSMRVVDLKELIIERDLPRTGNKAVLIKRLQDNDARTPLPPPFDKPRERLRYATQICSSRESSQTYTPTTKSDACSYHAEVNKERSQAWEMSRAQLLSLRLRNIVGSHRSLVRSTLHVYGRDLCQPYGMSQMPQCLGATERGVCSTRTRQLCRCLLRQPFSVFPLRDMYTRCDRSNKPARVSPGSLQPRDRVRRQDRGEAHDGRAEKMCPQSTPS